MHFSQKARVSASQLNARHQLVTTHKIRCLCYIFRYMLYLCIYHFFPERMALYTSLAKQKGVLHEGEVLNYKNKGTACCVS